MILPGLRGAGLVISVPESWRVVESEAVGNTEGESWR